MDPITGIGLAASVVQLVHFGLSAAKTCQQIYQQGSTSELIDLDYTTSHLVNLTGSLQQSLDSASMQSPALSKEERDLIDLARKCESRAHQLQHKLCKLQARPQGSTLEAARKAAHSIWKKNSILKIQEELDAYRKVLEMSLLARLSKRFDTQGIQTSERFNALDQSLKNIVSCLTNSQTSLATLVQQESERTRQHIDQVYKDDRFYQEVKKSLFYPNIFSRQEQVANEFDGIENSYEWIFDERSEVESEVDNKSKVSRKQPPWDNFSEWLRTGNAVYWINGKAGSGKSTLMNYICGHEKKTRSLKEWSSDRLLLTPTFFFWNAGVLQQKTIDGLLRSLIFQMLTECPELITCFKNELLLAWTEKRLLDTLAVLLRQTAIPLTVCLFIDGLDEFDGRYDAVLEAINNLTSDPHLNVKICLSSRPLLAFDKAFAGRPSLRLQDLTFDCIHGYATAQLYNTIRQQTFYNEKDKNIAEGLVRELVDRADGVFIWAVIAIRGLRSGLQDFVDLGELAKEMRSLPTGLEDLYERMLRKIKPAYQRDGVRFFQLVLYHSDQLRSSYILDLYRLYFIDRQRASGDSPLVYDEVDESTLIEACYWLRTRLLSHTLGLLDLTPTTEVQDLYGRRGQCNDILHTKVQFFHRTVKDFLLQNPAAKSFMEDVGSYEEHLRLCVARGSLSHIFHLLQHVSGDADINVLAQSIVDTIHTAMQQIRTVEKLAGAVQSELLQSLHTFSFIHGGLDIVNEMFYTKDPYIIWGLHKTSFDLIGIAASCGMDRYVCEILDLPFLELQRHPACLLDYHHTSFTRENMVTGLSWVASDEIELDHSHYRQQLSRFLKRDMHTPVADQTNVQLECNTITESYLLACCDLYDDSNLKAKLSLIRILLHSGANPMVQIPSNADFNFAQSWCFWRSWLLFLTFVKSPSFDPSDYTDAQAALDDVFSTTKALLAHGASIKYQITISNISAHKFDSKRDGQDHNLILLVSYTAMFWLKTCFNGYSEFRNFAAAVKRREKWPWRTIDSIYDDSHYGLSSLAKVYPNEMESKMLLPLLEKLEETGHSSDDDALQSAMERVWRAHEHEIRLEE